MRQPPSDDDIREHDDLIRQIVFNIFATLPPQATVQIDDMIQAGRLGLLDAWYKYNKKKECSFKTYAGIRIRGAIIDALRDEAYFSRYAYKNRDGSNAVYDLDLEKLKGKPVDDLPSDPEKLVDDLLQRNALEKAMQKLIIDDRIVISDYYYNGVRLVDSGKNLGVSEANAYQRRRRGERTLKKILVNTQ
jgi:RNA polymerase sigma factor (sigma-70 family)